MFLPMFFASVHLTSSLALAPPVPRPRWTPTKCRRSAPALGSRLPAPHRASAEHLRLETLVHGKKNNGFQNKMHRLTFFLKHFSANILSHWFEIFRMLVQFQHLPSSVKGQRQHFGWILSFAHVFEALDVAEEDGHFGWNTSWAVKDYNGQNHWNQYEFQYRLRIQIPKLIQRSVISLLSQKRGKKIRTEVPFRFCWYHSCMTRCFSNRPRLQCWLPLPRPSLASTRSPKGTLFLLAATAKINHRSCCFMWTCFKHVTKRLNMPKKCIYYIWNCWTIFETCFNKTWNFEAPPFELPGRAHTWTMRSWPRNPQRCWFLYTETTC